MVHTVLALLACSLQHWLSAIGYGPPLPPQSCFLQRSMINLYLPGYFAKPPRQFAPCVSVISDFRSCLRSVIGVVVVVVICPSGPDLFNCLSENPGSHPGKNR